MSEEKWLSCQDPWEMLRFVEISPFYASLADRRGSGWMDRKLRLFACACCRQVWHLLTRECEQRCGPCSGRGGWEDADDGQFVTHVDCGGTGRVRMNFSRLAVEAGERHADGLATEGELTAAQDAVSELLTEPPGGESRYAELMARCCLAGRDMMTRRVAYFGRGLQMSAAQADVVREVLGNPFRAAQEYQWQDDLATPWLQRVLNANGMRVWDVANNIYARRDWAALPVLADAILDVTGEEDVVTAHLRSPGPHCLGCWALDAILGK